MSQTRQPRVAILLLNYLNWEEMVVCVKSLQQITYSNYEILVVDNGSTNDAYKQLAHHLTGVQILETGENRGFTGGVNFGMRFLLEKLPDYILLLNPDTIVDPGFLEPMVKALEEDPKAAVAACTVLYEQPSNRVWYAGGKMKRFRGLAIHYKEEMPPDLRSVPREVDFVTGCAALYRSSSLSAIGLQDEDFFMYLDDIEYSLRIRSKGFKMLYAPNAIIFHRLEEGESDDLFKLYYSVRNRLLVIRKRLRGLTRIAAAAYFMGVILLKLAYWNIANRRKFEVARMALTDYFRGRLGMGRGLELPYRAGASSKSGTTAN